MRVKTVKIENYGMIQRAVMILEISQHAKLVYCLFNSYAGNSGKCYPSLTTISKNLRMGRATVLKSVAELVDIGLLEVETRYKKDGSKSSNMYYPMMIDETFDGSSQPEPPQYSGRTTGSSQPEPRVVPGENCNSNNINSNTNEQLNNPNGLFEIGSNGDIKPLGADHKSPPVAPAPPRSNYTVMMEIYYDWFKDRNDGTPPKIDGADGKALKSIVAYLVAVARAKLTEDREDTSEENVNFKACESLKFIFAKWTKLDAFIQKQVKLTQINSNISNIINHFKNGSKQQTAMQQKGDRSGSIETGFEIIENALRGKG